MPGAPILKASPEYPSGHGSPTKRYETFVARFAGVPERNRITIRPDAMCSLSKRCAHRLAASPRTTTLDATELNVNARGRMKENFSAGSGGK